MARIQPINLRVRPADLQPRNGSRGAAPRQRPSRRKSVRPHATALGTLCDVLPGPTAIGKDARSRALSRREPAWR